MANIFCSYPEIDSRNQWEQIKWKWNQPYDGHEHRYSQLLFLSFHKSLKRNDSLWRICIGIECSCISFHSNIVHIYTIYWIRVRLPLSFCCRCRVIATTTTITTMNECSQREIIKSSLCSFYEVIQNVYKNTQLMLF